VSYHLFGTLSVIFFFVSILGIYAQIRVIFKRKSLAHTEADGVSGYATHVLSLNQFFVAFLAFYAFFLYGFSIEKFNHYLVWPRLLALLLTLWILYEIFIDRRNRRSTLAFSCACVLLFLATLALISGSSYSVEGRYFAQILTVIITVLLAQAYIHQILLIRRLGDTGAISILMHQLALLKDVFTVCFGFAMGVATGWPLILLSGVSGLTKICILWHFRWIKSGAAQKIRDRLQVERV